MWSAAVEGQEVKESVMAMMAVKILTVIRQNPAFTLLYIAKCLIHDSHSISHKAEACLQFLVLPKASVYFHQFLISILTSVGKICLPIVSLQTKRTFCCGLCSYCTRSQLRNTLQEPCFMPLVLLTILRHLKKSFLTLLRPFPREMSIWRRALPSPRGTWSIALLLRVSLSQALCMNLNSHHYVESYVDQWLNLKFPQVRAWLRCRYASICVK